MRPPARALPATLACAGIIALLGTAAVRADGLDEVMQHLAARRHGEASFVEQHFIKLLKAPVESLGELRYDAPDRLEKRTLEPRAESLLLEGNVLTVTRRGRTRVLTLTDYPEILPLIEGLRATLAGDRPALERVFRVEFLGDLAHWALILVPRDAHIAARVAGVRIDGDRERLLAVAVREAGGDRSLLTLREQPAP